MSGIMGHMTPVRAPRATFTWADGSHPLCAIHTACRAAATGESHTLWDRVSVEGVPCTECTRLAELREVVRNGE